MGLFVLSTGAGSLDYVKAALGNLELFLEDCDDHRSLYLLDGFALNQLKEAQIIGEFENERLQRLQNEVDNLNMSDIAIRDGNTLSNPDTIQIYNDDQIKVFEINIKTGEATISEDVNFNDIAKQFWQAVISHSPYVLADNRHENERLALVQQVNDKQKALDHAKAELDAFEAK